MALFHGFCFLRLQRAQISSQAELHVRASNSWIFQFPVAIIPLLHSSYTLHVSSFVKYTPVLSILQHDYFPTWSNVHPEYFVSYVAIIRKYLVALIHTIQHKIFIMTLTQTLKSRQLIWKSFTFNISLTQLFCVPPTLQIFVPTTDEHSYMIINNILLTQVKVP